MDKVGEKAYGLSCIPSEWTLPFVVISKDLILKKNKNISKKWIAHIIKALENIHIGNDDDIIIRSSGCNEGLEERGQLYSCTGHVKSLKSSLDTCLNKILSDENIIDYEIPLVIQKYVSIVKAKGHLSNERRVKEFTRDWMVEIETYKPPSKIINFGLRNWRKKLAIEKYDNHKIFCNLESNIKESLRIPASWAYQKKLRLHFEWVWDDKTIYIVQADKEIESGDDPKKILRDYETFETLSTSILEPINKHHAKKYPKIENVFVYQELDLPIAPLFVLEDKEVLKQLLDEKIDQRLKNDLSMLLDRPLIIRTDINSKDLKKRQLLPREEVRSYKDAIKWLINTYITLSKEISDNVEVAFIFHNFIPSCSSAFAFATPTSRKVQIAALWGLPEGLYFNSHDKYVVDTLNPSVFKLDINKFKINLKKHHKGFFVSADESGNWHTNRLKPPYDWKESIENDNWIRQIALDSRRIAQKENKPLSIMWFVDVPMEVCPTRVFPWHHEDFDISLINKSKNNRQKTPFDRTFTIETEKDIEKLKEEVSVKNSTIKRINIQPKEDKLLRDKYLLQRVGNFAKNLNATIILEGSILSHAYYQLMQTGAIVEIYHPFDDFDDKQEFNKLVRDKIPENIQKGGEIVNAVKLSKASHLRALKDKLIEESFEVLDADNETIINELADVYEVIDGILSNLNVTHEELLEVKKKKFKKSGGFMDAKVLLDTNNPIPTKKVEKQQETLFDTDKDSLSLSEIDYEKLPSPKIEKYTDKRVLKDSYLHLARVTVPMTQDSWFSQLIDLDINNKDKAKITLRGKRIDASYQIELSVYTKKNLEASLPLDFDDD